MKTHEAVKDSRAGATQFLTFLLGDEVFAMDIRTVREIIQHGNLTPVPLMPNFVRGVINLRGAVVPVIDLQARFGRPPAKVGKKTCIVIFDSLSGVGASGGTSGGTSGERTEIGLMVDAVSEVISIEATQIEAPPTFGAAVRRDFISGMGKVGARFVVILDADRAFDVAEMAQLCETEQLALAA